MTGAWFLAAALAQAPTGYVSVLGDHLPNRGATEVRARVFVEEKADVGPGIRIAASGFVEGLLADRGGRVTDAVAEPQDATLTARGRFVEVTAGLGRVVWGRLDELQPTDVVNPLDLSRFFFEGRSEARMAVPLVRATIFAGDKASVDAIYVPFFRRGRFDRLDEDSSPFNVSPLRQGIGGRAPIEDLAPARTLGNAQGGARLNLTTGRVDWSLSTYSGFRPVGMYALQSLPAVASAEVGGLTRVYPRFTMIGGDFETVRGPWVLRGEVAAFTRDAFQSASAPIVFEGQSFDAGGGADRKAGDYRVSGQVIVHRESHDGGTRTDVSVILSADRQFRRDKYEARVFGVYNPRDEAGFFRGIATAALRDNVKLEGSLGWFAGRGADAIGRFADSDFAYLRLNWFF